MAQEIPSRSGGWRLVFLSILLAFVFTLVSLLYHKEVDPLCGNNISAGFPVSFLCDDTGGSPISSWGRIDLADIISLNLRAFLIDFFLYGALVSLAWTIVMTLRQSASSQVEVLRRGGLLCLAYLIVFLFAFLAFQSDHLDFNPPRPVTPTAFVPSPTPFRTPPPPAESPIPTVQ